MQRQTGSESANDGGCQRCYDECFFEVLLLDHIRVIHAGLESLGLDARKRQSAQRGRVVVEHLAMMYGLRLTHVAAAAAALG